jgi:hypothetical protein
VRDILVQIDGTRMLPLHVRFDAFGMTPFSVRSQIRNWLQGSGFIAAPDRKGHALEGRKSLN